MDALTPGAPFWSGFTAFCGNLTALFALDKIDALSIERLWLAVLGSFFVAGVVYGRSKVDELRRRREPPELAPGDY